MSESAGRRGGPTPSSRPRVLFLGAGQFGAARRPVGLRQPTGLGSTRQSPSASRAVDRRRPRGCLGRPPEPGPTCPWLEPPTNSRTHNDTPSDPRVEPFPNPPPQSQVSRQPGNHGRHGSQGRHPRRLPARHQRLPRKSAPAHAARAVMHFRSMHALGLTDPSVCLDNHLHPTATRARPEPPPTNQ